MKSLVVCMLVGLAMFGCAPGERGDMGFTGETGAPGSPAVVAPPTPGNTVAQDIAAVVADENAYRLGLGQTMLSSGLGAVLYTVTGGDRIQASITGHNTLTGITQVATFLVSDVINQADSPISQGMNVLPLALQPVYQNLYLLRVQGQVVILQDGYQAFQLTSDDGSVLYIDGAKLIDNDNNHGAATVVASKYMRRGVHTIRLDYAQTGAGNQALVLNMNGSLLSPSLMLH